MFSVIISNHGYKADSEYANEVRTMMVITGTGNSIIDNANVWNDNHQLLIYKQTITRDGFFYGDRNFLYMALGV